MRIEHYSLQKLKKEVITIMGRYIDLTNYKIFFFGSRVSGKGDDRSDIDVGIDGPLPISPEIKSKIEDEIENLPTLYKIEIVDFKRVPSKFRSVAMQNVEFINP